MNKNKIFKLSIVMLVVLMTAGYAHAVRYEKNSPEAAKIINQTNQLKQETLKADTAKTMVNSALIKEYDAKIAKEPDNAELYYKRGALKHETARFNSYLKEEPRKEMLKGALSDLSKAIELNPQMDNAYAIRGDVKALLGNDKAAVTDLSKAIELNPEESAYYEQRGLLLYFIDRQASDQDLYKAKELKKNKK